ncbi:MAG: FtsQ-type POTRA domain-containing protein [Desulfobulbaceae bacterium]|nr:FtsQ-type POTRA domain-containing protein [Desulfobulbaceae bacterium]
MRRRTFFSQLINLWLNRLPLSGLMKKLLPADLFSPCPGHKDYLLAHKRKKWLQKICFRFFYGGCITTLTACFLFIVFKAAIDSELFHINEIIINDTQHIKKDEILALIKVGHINSMLQFTDKGLRDKIVQLPWVMDAQVEKIWPSTLKITVTEYTPLSLINLGGDRQQMNLFYVTRDGYIFSGANGDHSLDYPIITGEFSNKKFDKIIPKDPAFERALQFLRLSTSSSILHTHLLSEINIGSKGELTVYLINHIFPITMGSGNIADCFKRLVSVYDDLRKNNELDKIEKITMDYHDKQILVSMNEPIRQSDNGRDED